MHVYYIQILHVWVCVLHSDTTSKLKSIHIREASNPVSTATVDDIKQSLKGLQLPSQHTVNISKAGSLNALHSKTFTHCTSEWSLIVDTTELNTIDLSPPSNRRIRSPVERYLNYVCNVEIYRYDRMGIVYRKTCEGESLCHFAILTCMI